MRDFDVHPAVRRIDTDRADVVALEITGHFTDASLANFHGLLEAAYQLHDEIDLLVRLSDYEPLDWDADPDRAATEEDEVRASKHIRRYALIGDSSDRRHAADVFGGLTARDARQFDAKEEMNAWDWIRARPVSD